MELHWWNSLLGALGWNCLVKNNSWEPLGSSLGGNPLVISDIAIAILADIFSDILSDIPDGVLSSIFYGILSGKARWDLKPAVDRSPERPTGI